MIVADFLTNSSFFGLDGDNTLFLTKTGARLNLPNGVLQLDPISCYDRRTLLLVAKKRRNSLLGEVLHREFPGSQIRYLVNAGGSEIVFDQSHSADKD